ncbi:phosphatase PAP2 family protein [Nonomuraea africana]|uniref:Undecaprenyl-diphosphatase n=1 Tax=Nonomuraea africana TaxID=46171 RepID=A0ABR9KVT4_9ACTN|nr:phosphatase PAP2 family protein [Nonomuraea africana]MBE1566146.1 undecaprenyl-diphosphatase [Nonomuraea africana]
MIARLSFALAVVPFGLLLHVARQPLNGLDMSVAHDLHAYAVANPAWTRFLAFWTDALGPATWRVLVVGIAAWLAWRGAPLTAAWAVITIVAGGLLGEGLKLLIDRTRPMFPDPVASAPGMSFPSGHALAATLGAGMLVLLARPALRGRRLLMALAWTAAALLTLAVSYTRVALGVHWVSDVVGGMLLGVAVLAVSVVAFRPVRRRRSPATARVRSP